MLSLKLLLIPIDVSQLVLCPVNYVYISTSIQTYIHTFMPHIYIFIYEYPIQDMGVHPALLLVQLTYLANAGRFCITIRK